jgi:hypothetical protein
MLKDVKAAKKDAKDIEQEMKFSYFHVTSGAKKDTNGCQMHWGGIFLNLLLFG